MPTKVVILFIIEQITLMENYNGSGTGTGKYTLDDLNEATGVTSSSKSSAAQFDRGQGNP